MASPKSNAEEELNTKDPNKVPPSEAEKLNGADEPAEAESGGAADEEDLEAQMAAALGEENTQDEDMERRIASDDTDSLDRDDLLDALTDEDEEHEIPIQPVKFPQLYTTEERGTHDDIERLLDVSLSISVELGRKQMQIKDILELGPGKIVELDKLAGEPIDLLVNGKLLARGEVVVVDENFGVRITDLIDPKDRIKIL
jgi:flagellar motor switch protein FliN